MIASLERIMADAFARLAGPAAAFLPRLIAAVLILGLGVLVAVLLRRIAAGTIKAAGVDRFLAQSGLASLLGLSGRFRTSRVVAGTIYWIAIAATILVALSALDTALTSRLIEGAIVLLPKLVTAGAIVLAGLWIGQYVGRSTLVWACNEGVSRPRTVASAVRAAVIVVAVVAAADHLNFARTVFLAGFIILFAGAAAGLAVGLATLARRHFTPPPAEHREQAELEPERSFWDHL